MAEVPDENHSRMPLDYNRPAPRKPRRVFAGAASLVAGLVVGSFFMGCISFNLWPNPNGLPFRGRIGIALLFAAASSICVVIAAYVAMRRDGRPRSLDDIFFAGLMAGAAIALFFAGSCYMMP